MLTNLSYKFDIAQLLSLEIINEILTLLIEEKLKKLTEIKISLDSCVLRSVFESLFPNFGQAVLIS